MSEGITNPFEEALRRELGAECATLRAEVERLRGLIKDAELDGSGRCPWCDANGYIVDGYEDEDPEHNKHCPAFNADGSPK